MDGLRPTPSRAGIPAVLVAVVLLLAGCAPPEPRPFTAGDREEICGILHDSVARTAATAVYSSIYLYRSYGPAVPGGRALPYPDCAYLARSEFADRLEVFYFGPEETLVGDIVEQLADTGYREDFGRWVALDVDGRPESFVRIEQFYAAPDAAAEFRVYAELISKPTVIVSITSRREERQGRRNSSGVSR